MKNWKAVAGIVLVFVLGMFAGGLVTVGVIRHRLLTHGPEVIANAIVRRLSWELRLDAGQRQQLRGIVTEAQQQMKVVRQQAQPQVTQIVDEAVAKVRATLRPEQQAKFDKLVAERRAKWAQ
jgi:uncharacterized membrane protein